jgi:hypothetical protein
VVKINVWIDDDMRKKFKKKLIDENKTITDFIKEKIKEYLDKDVDTQN